MDRLCLSKYKTIVFDCDGVILNSNKVKTNAFYEVCKPYGVKCAEELVEFHIANGGVSRYKKFEHFIANILKSEGHNLLDYLLNRFSDEVRTGLLNCEIDPSLDALKKVTAGANWLIVSGGSQAELRDIFSVRGINEYFDGGIFGSPDSKEVIFRREIECLNIKQPAIFLGDSKYDYEVSARVNVDFVFISRWTEVPDWVAYVKDHNVPSCHSIKNLIP